MASSSGSIKDAINALTSALSTASVEVRREVAAEFSAASAEIRDDLREAGADLRAAGREMGAELRASVVRDDEPRRTARQVRAEQTRSDLIAAAVKVFSERGYEGASVAEIAKAAGYTKGALYAHFETKEDLLIAAVVKVGSGDEVPMVPPAPSAITDHQILLGVEAYLYVLRHPGKRPDLEAMTSQNLGWIAEVVQRERLGDEAAGNPSKGDWFAALAFWGLPVLGALAGPWLGPALDWDEGVAWLIGLLENMPPDDPMFTADGPPGPSNLPPAEVFTGEPGSRESPGGLPG
ncbi:MAG: TetR/AcrR family transcriptional regulator [Promicromonosporaceae bacterium]|nr:TetR/AcrR family transcriptional regulator [Promicromonosporaceae bacterium]